MNFDNPSVFNDVRVQSGEGLFDIWDYRKNMPFSFSTLPRGREKTGFNKGLKYKVVDIKEEKKWKL